MSFFWSKNKVYFVLTCEMENSTLRPSDFFSSTWYSETKIQNKLKVISKSSLLWSFSCFLCCFCSTGVYSEYTSPFYICDSYLFRSLSSGLTIDVCIYKDNDVFTILMFKYSDTICILTWDLYEKGNAQQVTRKTGNSQRRGLCLTKREGNAQTVTNKTLKAINHWGKTNRK